MGRSRRYVDTNEAINMQGWDVNRDTETRE
jgi:hypothetical protein